MKKFLSLICALILFSCASTASAACDHPLGDPQEAEVSSTYAQYTAEWHWRTTFCTWNCILCGERYTIQWNADYFSHEFAGNTCTLCGYTRGQTIVCTHGGWCDGEYWDSYQTYSDTQHIVITYVDWKCLACGEEWTEERSRAYEAHGIFSNNKCTQCGYTSSSTGTYTKADYMADLQKSAYKLGDHLIDSTAKVVYTGDIRASASNTARILGKAHEDETYRIVDYKVHAKGDIWLEIEYGKQMAWISAGLVEIMLPVSEVGGAMPHLVGATVVVRVDSGYGLDAPGTDAVAIRTVVRGQKYKILDCAYDSRGKLWYKIKVNEQECWIASGCMEWP